MAVMVVVVVTSFFAWPRFAHFPTLFRPLSTGMVSYTVSLSCAPLASVKVTIKQDRVKRVFLSQSEIVFNVDSWNEQYNVNVKALAGSAVSERVLWVGE